MKSGSQVLLVEDDPGDVRLAMVILRKLHLDHRVTVVGDGEEAMDFLRLRGRFSQRAGELPAFILLDLKLPRVDGFEFLDRLKSDDQLKNVPVVVLTSSRHECDIERAYASGVNAYVVKGIDFQTYSATLRNIMLYWLIANEPGPELSRCLSVAAYPETSPWLDRRRINALTARREDPPERPPPRVADDSVPLQRSAGAKRRSLFVRGCSIMFWLRRLATRVANPCSVRHVVVSQ